MLSDFLAAFLAVAVLVVLFVGGSWVSRFILGAQRIEELKLYHRFRYLMVLLGCGYLSLMVFMTVIMPAIMIASGEPLSELPTILAVALMYLAFFLALILLWKYIAYRRNKDNECGFWKKVIVDLKGMFPEKNEKKNKRKVNQPWRCPNCLQENEGSEPFCIHCHTKRPEQKK